MATARSFSAFCVRRCWVGEPFAEPRARRREPAGQDLFQRLLEPLRRRILAQLNRGETRHALAREAFHGRRGELRQPYHQGQEEQLTALGLVVNWIALYNTIYAQRALDHLTPARHVIRATRTSNASGPLGHEHITLTGRYRIALPDPLRDRAAYRPLKTPPPDAAAT